MSLIKRNPQDFHHNSSLIQIPSRANQFPSIAGWVWGMVTLTVSSTW